MALRRSFAIVPAAILLITGVLFYVWYSRPTYQGIRAGRADENYLKSGDCRACHEGHYLSWARTYHSRMTREAKPATIQGDFDHNNSLDYLGVRARMERRGDGFAMSFTFPDGQTQTLSVDRTLGSRGEPGKQINCLSCHTMLGGDEKPAWQTPRCRPGGRRVTITSGVALPSQLAPTIRAFTSNFRLPLGLPFAA